MWCSEHVYLNITGIMPVHLLTSLVTLQIYLTTQIPWLSLTLDLFPDFSITFAEFPDISRNVVTLRWQ